MAARISVFGLKSQLSSLNSRALQDILPSELIVHLKTRFQAAVALSDQGL